MSDTSHISPPSFHVTAFTTQFQINLNWILQIVSRLIRAQACAPAAHDCALGGAPERRGAFGPRTAARDPKRCIRAVRATKIERTRTADMRSLARAANQRGEGARLVGGQAPWSQFLRGDNTWPLGSNGTCTVALTKRLDHMKCVKRDRPSRFSAVSRGFLIAAPPS